MSECTIIIPCCNEAERLDTSSFASFMDRYPDIAFLFVNDGSTDRTRDVLIRLCAARPNASFWELAENSGKAEAVRQGILKAAESESCGNFIGFWDADLSTSLEEIPRFLACARPGIWMVSGCRLRRLGGHVERSLIRHILGRSFATIISNYLDLPVYDTQCGAKLYAREEITAVTSRPFVTRWFFDVEILKRMKDRHGRSAMINNCYELPLQQWNEIVGSKLKYAATLKDFIKLIFSR